MDSDKEIIPQEIITEVITEITPITNNYEFKLNELKEKCKNYKQAHSYCKSVHFMYDKIIKIATLFLSTTTTYFISSHNEENLNAEDLDIDKKLTFATTIVSGMNAIFNFSEKIEIHKSLNSDYLKLLNEIDLSINTLNNNENIKDIYDKYYTRFNLLNEKTTNIGLIRYTKTKYNII